MAKQSSPLIKLKGTIDDLSFYKTQDGFLAREKTGFSTERIRTDPKLRRIYLNGLEFGTAGRAGKAFRDALQTEIARAADNRLVGRITRLMVDIMHTDPVNGLGERKVELGDLNMLANLEFNINVKLDQVFRPQVLTTFNRASGEATVNLPAFVPETDVVLPDGDTHFRVFAAAAEVDFANNSAITARQATANLPWNSSTVAADEFTLSLPPNSTLPQFIVVGVEFVKIVNTKVYPSSKGLSALKLVALDLP